MSSEPDSFDKITLKVIAPEVIISRLGDEKDFFVELSNNNSYEIKNDYEHTSSPKSFAAQASTVRQGGLITSTSKMFFSSYLLILLFSLRAPAIASSALSMESRPWNTNVSRPKSNAAEFVRPSTATSAALYRHRRQQVNQVARLPGKSRGRPSEEGQKNRKNLP